MCHFTETKQRVFDYNPLCMCVRFFHLLHAATINESLLIWSNTIHCTVNGVACIFLGVCVRKPIARESETLMSITLPSAACKLKERGIDFWATYNPFAKYRITRLTRVMGRLLEQKLTHHRVPFNFNEFFTASHTFIEMEEWTLHPFSSFTETEMYFCYKVFTKME